MKGSVLLCSLSEPTLRRLAALVAVSVIGGWGTLSCRCSDESGVEGPKANTAPGAISKATALGGQDPETAPTASPEKSPSTEEPPLSPESVERAEEKLEDFLDKDAYAEGLHWLENFGGELPSEARYRGLFHHGQGRADETVEALVPVYRAQPQDDRVALALAEASLWKKDLETARSVTKQLQDPEAPEALRVRGMALEQEGRLEAALALHDRAISKASSPWAALERRALVLSWLKRFNEARETYLRIIESEEAGEPLRVRSQLRLAEMRAWQKDYDAALRMLRELSKAHPNDVEVLLLQGRILEWAGRFREAKAVYSRILTRDSRNAEARLRLDELLWVE